MENINIIVYKPASGTVISSVSIPVVNISQFDQVALNVSLNGFNNPSSVEMSFSFPNGTVINDIHLSSSPEFPNVYSLSLTEIFNSNLTVGDQVTITITELNVIDNANSYTLSNLTTLQFRVYKTNTSASYTPDDIQKLFITVNDLQKQLNALTARVAELEAN